MVLLGLSLVRLTEFLIEPLALFLRLPAGPPYLLNSLISTTSLKSLLKELSFWIGLREAVAILPEINELELCNGIRLDLFLCTIWRLLFLEMATGTELISINCILFVPGGVICLFLIL